MIYFPLRGAGVSNTTLFAPPRGSASRSRMCCRRRSSPARRWRRCSVRRPFPTSIPEFDNPRVLQLNASSDEACGRRVARGRLHLQRVAEPSHRRISIDVWDRNLAPPTRFDRVRSRDRHPRGRTPRHDHRPGERARQLRSRPLSGASGLGRASRWRTGGRSTRATPSRRAPADGSTERDTEALFGPSDPFNPGADYGINELDERHQLKSYLVVMLPRDITLASTWSAGSGLAFPVYSPVDSTATA